MEVTNNESWLSEYLEGAEYHEQELQETEPLASDGQKWYLHSLVFEQHPNLWPERKELSLLEQEILNGLTLRRFEEILSFINHNIKGDLQYVEPKG